MRYAKLILSFLFLFIGSAIYLLFRSKSLLIFKCCEALSIDDFINRMRDVFAIIDIPSWVKYSLPDGLWLLSYLLLIDAIWGNQNTTRSYLWFAVLPIIAISSELLQYAGMLCGHFDVIDLACYIGVVLIFGTIKVLKI